MTMNIKPAEGKLGVLCVGLGAVTTTFITGTLMARKGLANPVGSFTQLGKMRVGRGENKQYKHVGEIVSHDRPQGCGIWCMGCIY